jgi:hypothetical protein
VLTPALVLAVTLLETPGRPLYYWGPRPACILTEAAVGGGIEARVTEVHGVVDEGELVLKVTFDRRVHEALYLPSGAPVSGRIRAALYVDGDGDRATGWAAEPGDSKGGADFRVDLGVLALGADPSEGIRAEALVIASAVALTAQGRQRSLWRGDHTATPERVSIRGEAIEVRLPAEDVPVVATARVVLIAEGRAFEGRLRP